jgi:hypothetical protein
MCKQIGGGEAEMSTYQRVKDLLEDGDWHTVDELKEVSQFPERWLEELRRDGLEVVEDVPEGRVALVGVHA